MSKRPNILFLMTDQHRFDLLGYAGNKVVRTPNLDKLSQRAVIFNNAYTPSPICIPARQCLMTGQLPKTCGCEVFGEDIAPNYETFARTFSRYSYATVCCGKLHHTGIDQMQGWTQRIGSDTSVSGAYIEGRIDEEFKKNIRPKSETRWSNAKEIKRAGVGRARNTAHDEYTVQGAKQFIEDFFISPYYDKEQPQRPLLLKVSLVLPHYPYYADEDKFKYYLNRVPLYLEEEVSEHQFLKEKHVKVGTDASEREIRRCVAAYYAMVETADENLGKVIDALEEAGQDLDDWIIVFTSDHGEMLGEHGIWAKHKFYEASAKVPFMIRWPNRYNEMKIVNENVNLCDIFATLCELCDIDVPTGLDSRSLVPLMEGNTESWSNETISQYQGKYLMIKWDDLKYQYYGEDITEVLFDLKANPQESINFINDAEYEDLVAKFRERRDKLGFGPRAESYVNAGY